MHGTMPRLSTAVASHNETMLILLVGEYSNVHWTLAEGLRALGHTVTVVSDGDRWKNYPRDIDVRRRSLSHWGAICYLARVLTVLPRLRGYDVVQLINPIFFDFRAARMWPFYHFLRRHNRRLFLGSYGIDYYWVKTCLDCTTFRYSDFNIGSRQRLEETFNQTFIHDWLNGEKTRLSRTVAAEADGIITGLYEYDCCYRPYFPDKTTFIPFPIRMDSVTPVPLHRMGEPVRFFIGIQRARSDYKGTDIMLRALQAVHARHPKEMEVVKVESVPYAQYVELMNSSHVILDQLYSYTPAMNALIAMARGLVVVGGGEEENYDILGETELRPIINVLPDEQDVQNKLEDLVLHPERVADLQRQSIEYVRRHHDYIKVARQYVAAWQRR